MQNTIQTLLVIGRIVYNIFGPCNWYELFSVTGCGPVIGKEEEEEGEGDDNEIEWEYCDDNVDDGDGDE